MRTILRRCVTALLVAGLVVATAAEPVEPFKGLSGLCNAPLRIEVRVPTVGELQALQLVEGSEVIGTYAVVQTGAAVGMVEAGVLPTVASSAAAVFIVILPVTWGIVTLWESSRRHALEQALAAVEFAPRAEATLRRRLPPGCVIRDGGNELQVLVLGYGLRSEGSEMACAYGVAQLRLRIEGQPEQVRRIAVGQPDGPPELPPPFCASQQRFLANDAALTRSALDDVAAIMGAAIALQLREPR